MPSNLAVQLSRNAQLPVVNTTDADITITAEDSRWLIFTGFSTARFITLPSTGIVAGDVWRLEFPTEFAGNDIRASNGSNLSIAAGTNLSPQAVQGTILLRAKISAPTLPAHWQIVNQYSRSTTPLFGTRWNVDASGVTTLGLMDSLGSMTRRVTRFTNLGTTPRAAQANGAPTGLFYCSITNDNAGKRGSFMYSVTLESGVIFRFSAATAQNCTVSGSNIGGGTVNYSITGLGDGKTYTMNLDQSNPAILFSVSSTNTGFTFLDITELGSYAG